MTNLAPLAPDCKPQFHPSAIISPEIIEEITLRFYLLAIDGPRSIEESISRSHTYVGHDGNAIVQNHITRVQASKTYLARTQHYLQVLTDMGLLRPEIFASPQKEQPQ